MIISRYKDVIHHELQWQTGYLYLGSYGISEVPLEISGMSWLKHLSLANNNISRIEHIENLTRLEYLNLQGNRISEIKNLPLSKHLDTLILRDNQINEIKNLEKLMNLLCLDLHNNLITEIKNLDSLKDLETLYLSNNKITKIENLYALANLQTLDLEFNLINDITNLEPLINLTSLYLNNNNITEIKAVHLLKNLRKVHFKNNSIKKIKFLKHLTSNPSLRVIRIDGSKDNDLAIPEEQFSDENVKLLQGYFSSIKGGTIKSTSIPIILVGNSTVGKTSLCHFIQTNSFPPKNEHSTHGIEPTIWKPDKSYIKKFDDSGILDTANFYFWDFGGQEYYHGTHRLFFLNEAVYILLWDVNTNFQGSLELPVMLKVKKGDYQEKNLRIDLFHYSYWLSSIRFQAPDIMSSPIIMIQSRTDLPQNKSKENPDPTLLKENNCIALSLSVKNAFTKATHGNSSPAFDLFMETLFSEARNIASTFLYGEKWEIIKQSVRQHKYLKLCRKEYFFELLREHTSNLGDEVLESYTRTLNAQRIIIYEHDDSFLQNYIFVDPAWVAEMIYTILDYSILENKGELKKEYVQEISAQEFSDLFINILTKEERIKLQELDNKGIDKSDILKKTVSEFSELCLALMKKFELIFEYEETYKDSKIVKYVAPQYLPNKLENINKMIELDAQFNSFEKPDIILQFRHFMPRYIMLRFLVAYGKNAIGKYYWKNGIAFMINQCSVLVLTDYDKKQFRVFTEGNNHFVQRLVFEKLVQLSENVNSLLVGINGNDFVDYTTLQEEFPNGKFSGNISIKTENSTRVALSGFKFLFEDIAIVKRTYNSKPPEKIKLFISYAHVDNYIRKLFEEKYLKAIQNHYDENIEVWSDIKLKAATGWDNKIKKEINEADIIIFFLSNGSLASDYIKNIEIEYALERYEQQQSIVVPIYIEEISKKILEKFPKEFLEKQYLPKEKPLREWRPQYKAWVKIQDGLITIIDDIKNEKKNRLFQIAYSYISINSSF